MLIWRNIIFLLILLNVCGEFVSAQNRKYYEKLRKSKKETIEYSKQLLNELKSTNEDQIDKLLITKEQIVKQKEVLNILTREISLIDEEISANEMRLEKLEMETKRVKDEYAQLIRFAYLNYDVQKKMIYILSADNFNKAYKRIIYLQHLSDYRKSRLEKIDISISNANSSLKDLNLKRNEKESLVAEKNANVDSLEKVRKQLNMLINVNSQEIDKLLSVAESENQKKEIAKENVTKQISIQEENKPVSDKVKSSKLDDNLTSKFENNKRFHLWPLSQFVILHHFGDYSHPLMTNIIVKNDGIEIGSKGGSNVHSIFEGKIVNVLNIPGDGNSIIIKHGEYYSVYTRIDFVLVKTGDIVQKGQVIAKLRKSDKIVKMNFQLWKGKEKLNPELWLKRQ